jgi:5-methyltetrahydrofolate--homocysteine methyltransferase
MKSLAMKIAQGRIFVSDGAWGTFLQQKGLKPGECPEEWNISHPDNVFEIAKSYIDAGADMILTNSFGGNEFKLSMYGLQDKVVKLNRVAAKISRKAAGSENYVLGSIGPTGKMIMMGDVSYEELYEAFKKQAVALEQGGVDALLVETMSDLDEAKAAVTACRDNTKCEVICTMTFEKSGEDEFNSMMGVTPTDMVNTMIEAGADIIGANCGNGMENMIGITREIRKANANIPILIHANAGAPVYRDGETVFLETPDITAGFVKPLIDAGANIIGGCCGTTPEHIARIVKVVKELK